MKAVSYCRYSDRRIKAGGDILSNDVQIGRIRPWCQAKGHVLVGEYDDELASGGSIDGRQGFLDALEHVKRVKGVLVCYSISRFARCSRDALNVAYDLEKAGAYLGLLDLDMDTSTPGGRAMFTVLSAFAQFHRELQNELTSDHMLAQQATGKRVSRHAPVGKRWVPVGSLTTENSKGELIPVCIAEDDPEEHRLISMVKQVAARLGRKDCTVSRKLREHGITFRGKPISRKVVARAIAYDGPLLLTETGIDPLPLGILPDAVQARLRENHQPASATG